MRKLIIVALFVCVSLVFVSCGSRELREEYYDSTTYGQDSYEHPWNSSLRGSF